MNSAIIERLADDGRLDRVFIGGEWVLLQGRPAGPSSTRRRKNPSRTSHWATHKTSRGRGRGAARLGDLVRELAPEQGHASRPRARLDAGAGRGVCPGGFAGDGCAISVARAAQVPIAAEHVRAARDLAVAIPLSRIGATRPSCARPSACGPDHPLELAALPDHHEGGPRAGSGSTVVFKPRRISQLSAFLFAEVMHNAGVPVGVFNLVKERRAEDWRRAGHAS